MKTQYKSNNNNIELKIVGYDEPNNGRDLHIAELYINGENCTRKYFKDNWNRLDFDLDNFQFESPDSKYIFIPAEANSFVINVNTLSIIYMPYKGLSTIYFKKNEFIENKIIIYYKDEIVEVNLDKTTKLEQSLTKGLALWKKGAKHRHSTMTKEAIRNTKFVSIKKKKLWDQTNMSIKILFSLFLLLGILFSFTDWKTTLFALIGNIAIYLFSRKWGYKWKFAMIVAAFFILKIILYLCFEMDLILYILATIFLFPLLFLKDIFSKQSKEIIDTDSEIFYVDDKVLKCADFKHYQAKQFGMDPFSFYETYELAKIKSISFSKNKIEIAYNDTVIRPQKLTKDDMEQIRNFITKNHPKLLNHTSITHNTKNENKNFIKWMLTYAFIIICFIGTYHLGENGRNKTVTYSLSATILIVYIYILWTDRKK